LRTAAQFAINEAQERNMVDRRKSREKAYHDIYEESKWLDAAMELYSERALWGSDKPLPFTKWRLDQVEGYGMDAQLVPCESQMAITSSLPLPALFTTRPQRMRRKLVPDTTFWQRYNETLLQADVAVQLNTSSARV
jgi:hypothetical protein